MNTTPGTTTSPNNLDHEPERPQVVSDNPKTQSAPAGEGECVVFADGTREYADRHQTIGEMVRLYRGDSFREVPTSQVVSFESGDDLKLVRYIDPSSGKLITTARFALRQMEALKKEK